MAEKLADGKVRGAPLPQKGFRIIYDSEVKGFGVRVTAAGARSFVLNYRTRAGRERRYTIGSFPDWTSTAARAEACELKKLIDRGGDPLHDLQSARDAPSVSDLCNRVIEEHLPRKRPSTQNTYVRQIETEIRPALGRLKVDAVTFTDVDKLHQCITRRAPYQANRVLALLSRMFSLAIRWEMRRDNPCEGLERNHEDKRRRYLSTDELARLTIALAQLKDQQGADVIRLLLLTGARRGEVLACRWDQIDISSGTWSKPGATTKQRTAHHVPLSGAARQLLAKLEDKRSPNAEWVFPVLGTHRSDVQPAWRAVCKSAGIVGARLHDLRHTYASVLASEGLSLPIIGALLGHTTPATTARYAHLFNDPLRAATERAGLIISGKSGDVAPILGGNKA